MKKHHNRPAKKPLDIAGTVHDYSQASRKLAASNRWMRWFGAVVSLVVIALICEVKTQGVFLPLWFFIAIATAFVAALNLPHLTKTSELAKEQKREAASKLMQVRDLSGLGPLIEHLSVVDAKSKVRIAASIMDMLPKLRSAAAAQLEPRHWKLLGDTLNGVFWVKVPRTREMVVEYNVRVLEALAAFGNTDSVPVLEQLSQIRVSRSDSAGLARIQECATESLAKLQDRLARQAVGDDLLRPAELAVNGLLRPVQPHETEDGGKNLLRPVS